MHFKIDCSQTILNGWTNLPLVWHFAYLSRSIHVRTDTHTRRHTKAFGSSKWYILNFIDLTGLANFYCAYNFYAHSIFRLKKIWMCIFRLMNQLTRSIHRQIVFDSDHRTHSMHIPIFIATQSFRECTLHLHNSSSIARAMHSHRSRAFLIKRREKKLPKSHCLGNSLLDIWVLLQNIRHIDVCVSVICATTEILSEVLLCWILIRNKK